MTNGDAPADVASAAAIGAPGDHPVPNVQPLGGEAPELEPVEPDNELIAGLIDAFEEAVLTTSHGQDVVQLPRRNLAEFGLAAREAGFELCADVTAVDWFRRRPVRFEVVVNLVSLQHRRRLRIVVPVPSDDPTVPSLVPVWPGANFAEREVYDMFGIVFEGHPDLTRILMPDDWEGFPLRKDFSVGSVPVQFKDNHQVT